MNVPAKDLESTEYHIFLKFKTNNTILKINPLAVTSLVGIVVIQIYMSQSIWAALTIYHRLGGLETTDFFHSFGDWEVQDQGVNRGLVRACFLVPRWLFPP